MEEIEKIQKELVYVRFLLGGIFTKMCKDSIVRNSNGELLSSIEFLKNMSKIKELTEVVVPKKLEDYYLQKMPHPSVHVEDDFFTWVEKEDPNLAEEEKKNE